MKRLAFVLVVLFLGVTAFKSIRFHTKTHSAEAAHRQLFQFDPVLGWRPRANMDLHAIASRKFHVVSNADGFRDSVVKPSGKPAILFVGDSFTWGYEVDNAELFSEKLQRHLPQYEIRNQGVSAFGTDQTYLLLQETLPQVQPKMVGLIFCSENDRWDNTHRYHGNYPKPFFSLVDGKLTLGRIGTEGHDTISPDPTFALLAAMKNLVHGSGSYFFVALTAPENEIESFLKTSQIPNFVLERIERYSGEGNHWTAKGHEEVAKQMADFVKGLSPDTYGDKHSSNRQSSKVFHTSREHRNNRPVAVVSSRGR